MKESYIKFCRREDPVTRQIEILETYNDTELSAEEKEED
jgi:hypothetical protein